VAFVQVRHSIERSAVVLAIFSDRLQIKGLLLARHISNRPWPSVQVQPIGLLRKEELGTLIQGLNQAKYFIRKHYVELGKNWKIFGGVAGGIGIRDADLCGF
jgi:hypothetical protein